VDDPLIQRCSAFARAEGLDPAGTAGSYRGYVVLDVPLPWPGVQFVRWRRDGGVVWTRTDRRNCSTALAE
jgi:hypothetical protein